MGDVEVFKVVRWSFGSREHSRQKSCMVGKVWDGYCSRPPNLFVVLRFQKELDELFLLTGLLCGLSLLLCGLVLLHCVTAFDISRDNKCFTLLWSLSVLSGSCHDAELFFGIVTVTN